MKKANTRYDANYYMYSANALAPEYQEPAQPVVRKATRPVRRKHFIAMTMPNVMRILCAFVLAVALVGEFIYIQGLGYQVGQSKAELSVILQDNEKMKQEYAALGDLKTIEQYATTQLGMVKPSDNVAYLPNNTLDTEKIPVTEATPTSHQTNGVMRAIGELLGQFRG